MQDTKLYIWWDLGRLVGNFMPSDPEIPKSCLPLATALSC